LRHRFETRVGRGRKRFERTRRLVIAERDREEDRDGCFAREGDEQIEVASNQSRLRDDADRIAKLQTDLQTFSRQLVMRFERQVGVGREGEDEFIAFPGGAHQLFSQQLRRVNLDNDLPFKVGARAEAEILVRGAREAVSAGMRAAAIDVDAVVEANVRAVVPVDDRARGLFLKDFLCRFRRLADPLDVRGIPRIGGIFDVTHEGYSQPVILPAS
jgi:hypothetical protein